MSDIQSSLQKMNDQEISSDAALSQALMLKIGANINGLIDRNNRSVTFTASGTWTCPADVTRVTLLGAGGGGGGGTSTSIGNGTNYGGAGGGGSVPLSTTLTVVPNTTYTITIGAGGAGSYLNSSGTYVEAQSGGQTSFGTIARFAGAAGAYFATDGNNRTLPPPSNLTPLITQTAGGFGSNSGGFNATAGGASLSGLGGNPGTQSSGGQAGAGGGAGLASGGNGGNGNGANATTGFNGGISAGGGGGAYALDNNNPIRAGGTGGSGYLVISY